MSVIADVYHAITPPECPIPQTLSSVPCQRFLCSKYRSEGGFFTLVNFDVIADSYCDSTPPPPIEYANLIGDLFVITHDDEVLDLGCGSGLLTFLLASRSSRLIGLDVSSQMIRRAQDLDKKGQVRWIRGAVEDFDFGIEHYKLIISFEAFHLFSDSRAIVARCMDALQVGGYFAVGWVDYHWERRLYCIVNETFARYGIDWGDKVNPAEVNFGSLVETMSPFVSPIVDATVKVFSLSHIDTLAAYLSSIGMVVGLTKSKRESLRLSLRDAMYRALSSWWISGTSTYHLRYCQKLDLQLGNLHSVDQSL